MWVGQLVSTTGSALTSIAAGILVFRLTDSALAVGAMLMVTALPSLVVGLVAGVFVDRSDRRRILMVADLIRCLLVFMIPILTSLGIGWLYVLVFLASAVSTFFDPAFESVLPELAPDEELASANALMSISGFGATAIGFAAAGFLATAVSVNFAFWIDALTFLFSAGCIFLVRFPALPTEAVETSVASVATNLRVGLGFLARTTILRSLMFVSFLVFLSIGLWNSLLLPFAIRALHATEFEYSLQEAITSVGFVASSLLMAKYADRLREGQWLSLSYLAMGVVGMLYAGSSSVGLAILLVTLSGFANAPASIGRRLIIQRHTPRELRGRVNSGFMVARDLVFLVGMACAGIADIVDVRYLVMTSAVLLVAAGLFALVLPGLGQPAAEWRRSVALLRAAPQAAGGLSAGRIPNLEDLDRLFGHLPVLLNLPERDRDAMLNRSLVRDATPGARIVAMGETSTAAYFILDGQVLVGHIREDGTYRNLNSLVAGDYFGEIAALTGSPRTADVVATQPTTLLEVPADVLRGFMANDVLNRLILAKMSERLTERYAADLPRLSGLAQDDLLDLRTPRAEELAPVAQGGAA
jgi:CRP-like cAMP-binding protein/predicted MFS family arabinose efflux permease